MSEGQQIPVRVRFAPAPTGPLHLGGARTALLNWLFARHHGGEFILRIENTDAVRSSEVFEKAILGDLRWLGLQWDEGPYRQAERGDIYRGELEKLRQSQRVYPCFCTHEQLEAARRRQVGRGEPPRYDGTCRGLDPSEAGLRISQGQRHTWRFAMGQGGYVIEDLIRGPVRFEISDLGDFIVARSDGSFPYLFASAVDDATMKITHVLRGEDGLSNAPRQGRLIEALGYKAPICAHLSLLLDLEGKKLAKRDASFTVETLRERQVPAEALFHYLAGLGYPPAAGAGLSREELIRTFDITKLSHSPAKVDLAALDHVSSQIFRELSPEQFATEARERLRGGGVNLPEGPIVDEALAGAFQTQLTDWTELEQAVADLQAGRVALGKTEEALLASKEAEQVLQAFAAANEDVGEAWSGEAVLEKLRAQFTGVKGRALFGPVRAALTRAAHGPELKHLITLLGRERVRERVARALAQLHQND